MKKFLFLLLAVVVLSGCGNKTNDKKTVNSDGGIYKSRDAGETFHAINKIDDTENLSTATILDIVISPQDAKTIYVGTATQGIFISEDAGETWHRSRSEFEYVRKIVLDPNDINTLYIVAKQNDEVALFKTTDRGINWTKLLLQRDKVQPIVLGLLMDNKNPQIIYASDSTGGVYKSTNGGKEWQAIYWAEYPVVGIIMDSKNNNLLYFITNDQQIYKTEDAGKTFKTIEASVPIYSVAVSKITPGVFYVLYENGLKVTRDGGNTFQEIKILLPKGNMVANIIVTDPDSDDILYLVAGQVVYKTNNGGQTWQAIPLRLTNRLANKFVVDSNNHNIIYLGTRAMPKKKRGLKFVR
jgi:photosystem II stability/assembly factor-like uncharacterized protein